mgnify:CR=1 FL=1
MSKIVVDAVGRLVGSPIGTHVVYVHDGRTLLGEVICIRMREDEGERMRVLTVKHFNGEPWPVEPFFWDVDVLDRGFEEPD